MKRKILLVTAVLAIAVSLIFSNTVIFAESEIFSLKYDVTQQIIEDGAMAIITLEFEQQQFVSLNKVKLPNGTEQTENLSTITYKVNENGTYSFTFYYTENEIEKEETTSIEISHILRKESKVLLSSGTYSVGQSDFDRVIADIKLSDIKEVELVLRENIAASTPFVGIEGKHVTLKSADKNCFSINMGNEMLGDLTLDNVAAFNIDSHIYANGHLFETTTHFHSQKNYSGKEIINSLYGGGKNKDVTGDTNLIIRGGSFIYVYGGGYDSSVSGNVNILIDNSKQNYISNLRGGGYAKNTNSGTVGGNINLNLHQGNVTSLYGGGENQTKSLSREPARVFGDVNITSGYVGADEATMWIGSNTDSNGGSIKSTVTNVNFSMLEGTINYALKEDGSYNGGSGDTNGAGDCDDVLGTINILVENARINTLNGSGYVSVDSSDTCKVNGYHSRVMNQDKKDNAIHIVWDNRPELDETNKGSGAGIVGTGFQANDDYVDGNILVEYKNGDIDFIQATHNDHGVDMSKLDGNFNVEMTGGRVAYIRGSINNYGNKPQAFTSNVLFDGCSNSEIGYLYYMDEVKMINNSNLLIDSDKFSQFGGTEQSPFYSTRNLLITGESQLTTRNSQTLLQNNVTIDNGTWHALGNVYVYEKMKSKDGHIFFDNYFALGYNHKNNGDKATQFTALESQNDEFIALNSGYTDQIYGNANLEKSDLAFLSLVNVSGNWNGGNSLLRLPVVVHNYDGTSVAGNIALNIDGTATESTTVNTVSVDNWKVLQKPTIGDNYITGYKLNNPLQEVFVLGNQDALNEGYYLKRVLNPADEENYFMWQVAKNPVYSVTYEFISGTKGYGLPEEVSDLLPIDSKNYIEGSTVTAIQPTETEVKVTDGIWIFKEYDANTNEVTSNLHFTGTWIFKKNGSVINQIPLISAENRILTIGDTFDPLNGVTASDKEDGNITYKIEVIKNVVDTSKAGIYEITYKVTDSQGASFTKTIKITVKAIAKPLTPIGPAKSTVPNTSTDSQISIPQTEDTTKADIYIAMLLLAILSMTIIAKKRNNPITKNND